MSIVVVILKQVIIMFILAFVGYLMFRYHKISNEGSKTIGNILIYLSLPCVIINSFLVDRTPEKIKGLLLSAVLAFLIILIGGLLSRLILGRRAIDCFAGTFANPGFFGIPIIVASLADGAVFYVAAFIAFLNMGQWTYGVWLLNNSDQNGDLMNRQERATLAQNSGERSGKAAGMLKKIFTAPFMIAIIIGLFFFFTGIPMPQMATKCMGFVVAVNTPLSMFSIGIYLAQTNIGKMFVKPSLYRVSLVKMIIVPAVAVALLPLVPNSMLEMKLALLIASACPVGSNIAVYAQLHDRNYPYAVETVVISTMLSIVTIPVIVGIASALWA